MPTVSVAADFKAYAAFAKTLDKAAATAFRAGIRKAVKTVGDESLQRAKQNAVDHAIDRRRRADADRDCRDGNGGQRRAASPGTNRYIGVTNGHARPRFAVCC